MTDRMKAPPANGARFAAGLVIGLVVGAGLGAAAARLIKPHHPDPWIEAGGEWVRLPSQAAAGALPQTFTTPAQAWAYGATTHALPATLTARSPVVVRVEVADVSGPVGVSLAKPDGSALISKETTAPVGPGPARMYFLETTPAEIAVLVRNYDGAGKAGAVTVRGVRYAPVATLSPAELGAVNKAGLH